MPHSPAADATTVETTGSETHRYRARVPEGRRLGLRFLHDAGAFGSRVVIMELGAGIAVADRRCLDDAKRISARMSAFRVSSDACATSPHETQHCARGVDR